MPEPVYHTNGLFAVIVIVSWGVPECRSLVYSVTVWSLEIRIACSLVFVNARATCWSVVVPATVNSRLSSVSPVGLTEPVTGVPPLDQVKSNLWLIDTVASSTDPQRRITNQGPGVLELVRPGQLVLCVLPRQSLARRRRGRDRGRLLQRVTPPRRWRLRPGAVSHRLAALRGAVRREPPRHLLLWQGVQRRPVDE